MNIYRTEDVLQLWKQKNLYEQELHARRIENRINEVEHVAEVANSLAKHAISVANTALDRANKALG